MFHPTAVRSTVLGAVVALACTVAGAETVVASASPDTNAVGFFKRVEGSAMLSQGAQYVDATSGMKFYDLDRVMVLEESSAALELADGCIYEVQSSQILTVQAGDTCKTLAARAAAQGDMSQIERSATSQIRPSTLSAVAAAAAPGDLIPFWMGSTGTLFGMTAGTALVASTAFIGTAIALAQGTGSDDRQATQPNLSPQ